MKKESFVMMDKQEQAKTYGGFAIAALITAVSAAIQVIVSSTIAIYQTVKSKTGSVSFAGSRTITNKEIAKPKSTTKKTKSRSGPPEYFSAY